MADVTFDPSQPSTLVSDAPQFDPSKPSTRVEFDPSQPSTLVADKPDLISRIFSALARGPASQREESQIEVAHADTPFVTVSPGAISNLPNMQLLPEGVRNGISKELAGLATAATTPSSIATMLGAVVAPELVGGVLAGLGAKSAGEAAGQATIAFDQGQTEEGAQLATRAVAGAAQALIAPVLGVKASRVPLTEAAVAKTTADLVMPETGTPPIANLDRLLPAPRTRMPEFQDSTLGLDRNQRQLPAPGDSGATSGLLPESPLGPRTAGYRIKVPPFAERPIIDLDPATPEAVDNLRTLVKVSNASEPTAASPYKAPEVSTDLRQLQGVMQRNSVSTLETWADGVIKDKLGGASANPYLDPEFLSAALVKGTVLLKRGTTAFADWSAPMIDQFGRDIIPHLEMLFKSARDAAGQTSSEPNKLTLDSPVSSGTAIPSTASVPLQSAFGVATSPVSTFSDGVREWWRGFANEALPSITTANREVGEAGVRSVMAHKVGRNMGEIFADKVLDGLDVDPHALGVFAAEDNLRWREADFRTKAQEAAQRGEHEDASTLNEAADAVGTLVGGKNSPFATREDLLKFWDQPDVKEAARRHADMWREQKDPLYRQANDLDPETPLASRGLLSGMRLNMKAIRDGETSPTAVVVRDAITGADRVGGEAGTGGPGNERRSTLVRQMATLKRNDPFNRTFTGLSPVYEGDYHELMRNGFGRELPVAAQHEFQRKFIEAGDAIVTSHQYEPDLRIKGETTAPFLNKFKQSVAGPPEWFHVRESLAKEYDIATGLDPSRALPVLGKVADIFTKSAIAGLAEGTTHVSNLMSQIFTGPGPTANPLLNGLIKSLGRPDLLYSIPRVFARAMKATKEDVTALMAEGAAKEPYSKVDPNAPAWRQAIQRNGLGKLLTQTDVGVRLVSKDLYDGFVKTGWITDASETGQREFINQVGNYERRLQPLLMRQLRDTVQPFATAVHTFNTAGLRRLAGSAGIRDLTPMQRLAFAADIYGGWVGFVTGVLGLNYLLNRNNEGTLAEKLQGPTGTPLGHVGWIDSSGDLRTLNVARIMGYERGLKAIGVLPAAEALRRGQSGTAALDAGAMSVANTALHYVTGPMVQAASVAATGKTPSAPGFQEAPVMPPRDDFAPLKSQMAANIGTALREMNPLIDSTMVIAEGVHKGHSAGQVAEDVAKKQINRYYPATRSLLSQNENYASILQKAHLNEYVEDVARRAHKLPDDEKNAYLDKALADVPDQLKAGALRKLKEHGAWRPNIKAAAKP